MRLAPSRSAEPIVPPDLLAAASPRTDFAASDTEASVPRPVFILGTLRSGASLLTLSLGQHSNLFQALETNWFERFGIGLQQAFAEGLRFRSRSQLDVAGIEIEEFFAYFGAAIDRLILRSAAGGGAETIDESAGPSYHPQRWVDGTPSNCYAVFVLTRLFPAARFIHVVRDVDEVVTALTKSTLRRLYRSRFLRLTDVQTYRHWLDTTNACLEAERAFGSSVVLRVRRADLIRAPESTLRRCLDFLGEPFEPALLRPFSSVQPVEHVREEHGDSALRRARLRNVRAEAEALNYLIAEEDRLGITYPEDPLRIARMEAAFSARCERGESAVPPSLPEFGRARDPGGGRLSPTALVRTVIDRERGSR
jgi:hypothetical protein